MIDLPKVGSLPWVKWQAHMWAEYVRGWGGDVATFWSELPRLGEGIGSASFQRAASIAREVVTP